MDRGDLQFHHANLRAKQPVGLPPALCCRLFACLLRKVKALQLLGEWRTRGAASVHAANLLQAATECPSASARVEGYAADEVTYSPESNFVFASILTQDLRFDGEKLLTRGEIGRGYCADEGPSPIFFGIHVVWVSCRNSCKLDYSFRPRYMRCR